MEFITNLSRFSKGNNLIAGAFVCRKANFYFPSTKQQNNKTTTIVAQENTAYRKTGKDECTAQSSACAW